MMRVKRYKIRKPTEKRPLRILMSACLMGNLCGYDGSSYGSYPDLLKLKKYPNVAITTFCPEDHAFGTPRELCDIHGGDGFDVLDGKARVLTESGKDWSNAMIKASEKMLAVAQENQIELAILMDISAACGSQVIYDGNRLSDNLTYQIGFGVCAAQLIKNNIPVIAQRDYASLEYLFNLIDPTHEINSQKLDHHQTGWYKDYFDPKS